MRKYIIYTMLAAAMTVSCTDYLDQAPESEISSTDAYKDFRNFQGFVEELYYCIPDYAKAYWNSSWNWGDDEIMNVGTDYLLGYKIDQGDFWGWQKEHDGWGAGPLDRGVFDTGSDRMHKGLWPCCWYGIRKANMGIENLDKMSGTQEEKNLVAGQLYFFRGWFHFQLIQYFGGLPYIDSVLPSNEQLKLPRITYRECAERAASDFQRAAELLPVNWDETVVGRNTYGKNQLRITKIAALGYLGTNYLWAASPLMQSQLVTPKDTQVGSGAYDQALCQKAAEAFGQLLTMVENGKTQFGLLPFDEYSANFYTRDQNHKLPGRSQDNSVTEAVFMGPSFDWNSTLWNTIKEFGGEEINDAGVVLSPTANYIQNYGMVNGLPLGDSNSGFDKTHPWQSRDPRFYHDIIFDGCKVVQGTLSKANEKWRYADMQTDGLFRDDIRGSRTGYFNYKFIDITCNKYDDGYAYSHQCHIHLPWMRLADVYLMYAESVFEATGSPTTSTRQCALTAQDAVNKIRRRAGVADVGSAYVADPDKFRSELRRERAVELSFEGHRFNDLRRWMLLDKEPYTIKTSQEFQRVGVNNTAAPQSNQVAGYTEKVLFTRQFTSKHYWLPLKRTDTSMYLEFEQNPGW